MTAQRTALGVCAATACFLTLLHYAFNIHFAFNNDTLNFSHNNAQALQAALWSGDLPFWNRLEGAGIDQLAEGSKDFVLAWLLLILDAKSYLVVGGFVFLAASMFGFYWFGVNVGLRPWPAFVGSSIWAANGFSLWHLHELNQQSVIAWLPVVLGAIAILDTRPRLARAMLVVATAAGLSYGRLELTECTFATAVLFILVWFPRGRRLAPLCSLGIAVILGSLVVAWFLIPYFHALATSARIGQVRLPVYLPWNALLRHLLPSIDVGVASRAFVPLVALPLCVIGLRRRRWASSLGGMLIAVYVLLSYDTGVYPLVQALPLHGANWNVERFIVLFFFAASLLAAWGIDALEPGGVPPSPRFLTSVLLLTGTGCAALAVAVLRTFDVPRAVVVLNVVQLVACAGIVLALVIFARPNRPFLNRVALSAAAVGALAFGLGFDRLDRNDGELALVEKTYFGRLSGEIPSPARALEAAAGGEPFRVIAEMIFHPSFWAGQGVESFGYYTPFADRRLVGYVSALEQGRRLDVPLDRRGESTLARLGNVRFVCTFRTDVPPSWRTVYDTAGMRCYERSDMLSRVRLVKEVRVLANGEDAVAVVSGIGARDPSWLERGVIAESAVSLPAAISGDDGSQDRAVVTRRDTNALNVDVKSRSGTVLTIAERFDEGWSVSIDRSPAHLFRVNGLFQAVVVPAGQHTVTFRYRPWYFTLGVTLALVGLVASWWWVRAGVRHDGAPLTC